MTNYPPMESSEYEQVRAYYSRLFDLRGPAFAHMLGVSWRQEQRYASGESVIPVAVAKLICTAIKRKLKPEEIG